MLIVKKIKSLFSTQQTLPRVNTFAINVEAVSDVGLVRDNNEDSYLSLPEHYLWAIADGMGGYDGGEIASAIALNSLKSAITSGLNLSDAIQVAHRSIEQAACEGLGSKGMGSTIVVIQIEHDHYQIGWVGDSRAYLYRENCEKTLVESTSEKTNIPQFSGLRSLRCLTKDHSYVQCLLDQGLISESEVENHPQKNVITQALGGVGQTISVSCINGKLHTGDIFLLCSDGLSGKVSAKNMEVVLANKSTSLATKSSELLQQALTAGGDDNITFILLMMNAAHPGLRNSASPG